MAIASSLHALCSCMWSLSARPRGQTRSRKSPVISSRRFGSEPSVCPLALPRASNLTRRLLYPIAFCEVHLERIEMDGKPYAIGFEIRLPDAWNGRYFHQANGGADGEIVPAYGPLLGGDGTKNALTLGYAVLSRCWPRRQGFPRVCARWWQRVRPRSASPDGLRLHLHAQTVPFGAGRTEGLLRPRAGLFLHGRLLERWPTRNDRGFPLPATLSRHPRGLARI